MSIVALVIAPLLVKDVPAAAAKVDTKAKIESVVTVQAAAVSVQK